MPNKRGGLGDLISDASSDIQPIKRGGGLSGLIGGRQRPPVAPAPASDERGQQPGPVEPPEETAAAALPDDHARQPQQRIPPRERGTPVARARQSTSARPRAA